MKQGRVELDWDYPNSHFGFTFWLGLRLATSILLLFLIAYALQKLFKDKAFLQSNQANLQINIHWYCAPNGGHDD